MRSLRERGAFTIGSCPTDWIENDGGYGSSPPTKAHAPLSLTPHAPPPAEFVDTCMAPARFGAVFRAMDCLLPWTVGGFADSAGAADYFGGRWRADAAAVRREWRDAESAARGPRGTARGWLPGEELGAVVWPGASRAHQWRRPGEYNSVPRRGGLFLWEQCRRAVREGALFVFVATFDEVKPEGVVSHPMVE